MKGKPMLRKISEGDWKLFRKFHAIALERFCERVLSEVAGLAAETGRSSHDRYVDIYELINKKDKQMADAFDDIRRSTALLQVAHLRGLDLLTEEEFRCFSSETRAIVQLILGGA